MDCRKSLRLALLVLGCVAGCETLAPWSSPDAREKAVAADEKEASKNRVVWTEQTKLKPETIVAFAKLLEDSASDPNAPEAERERHLEQARLKYQLALQEDPTFVPAHLGLARLMESTGRHDRALECYAQALKHAPKDKTVWHEIGVVHARHKEWEPALDCLRKAVALDPDDKMIAKTLGLTLARSGRYEDSFATLRQAGVSEAEARCHVARMLHHMNQDDAAREHVQLALQADPNLRTAQELLAELNGGTAINREPSE